MHRDQTHDRHGQFTSRDYRHDQPDTTERLEFPVSCKVSTRELRMYGIMFDQNRKQFGWQTVSDMYRAMLASGYVGLVAKVKNPTADMKRMARQMEELERIDAEAVKHRNLDRIMEKVHRDIDDTIQTGDLASVRRMLSELVAKTKAEDDPALRQRRKVEFDKRYGNLWVSLNRGISLDPNTFVDED